ncbi:MAG: hypothetical protein K8S98_17895 [Planctomycetes bacterium]|nr:hypothetical protein [Planctomycetota bacterium]
MSIPFRSLSCWLLLIGPAFAQTTARVSVADGGLQANAIAREAKLSADARFVSFGSPANNLVAGDGNGSWDVFVRDRFTGQTTRVTVSSAGVEQSPSVTFHSSLSADGRFVAFDSEAANLVLGDGNAAIDVFLHDRLTGATTRVSVASNGLEGDGPSSFPVLSSDGRWATFNGFATNLVAGDGNGTWDVFARDTQTGQTVRASVDSNGVEGNQQSVEPALSGDGRFVAFRSLASNLIAADTNGLEDVFVHDLTTGQTICATRTPAGLASNGGSLRARLSDDGRFVAFTSDASDLVPSDTNAKRDAFVRDLTAGVTTRVSVATGGAQALGISDVGDLSADGRWVVFSSSASNLVPGDTNSVTDVFVHDRWSGETKRISVASNGVEGDQASDGGMLSADGRTLVFTSHADNLVPFDTNVAQDVFVRDENCAAPVAYCTAKVNSLCCSPSILLLGAASASTGSGALLSTTQVLGNKSGLYFHSVIAPVALPFHGGWLCVKAPTKRHGATNSGGTAGTCTGVFNEDFNVYIASGVDPALVAGATVNLQHWSRDPGAPFGDSLSNALTAMICP